MHDMNVCMYGDYYIYYLDMRSQYSLVSIVVRSFA